jgi:hypothetical protein
MHRKPIFFLAGIFLVIAIVAPVALILLAENDPNKWIIVQNPNGQQTNGNISIVPATKAIPQSTFEMAAIIATVFISLFAVTVYYGVKHAHPKH